MRKQTLVPYTDIPGFETWQRIEKIDKGYSQDEKYKITTEDGSPLLLRLSDGNLYAQKAKEYAIIQKYVCAGFTMSFPKNFGMCNSGQNTFMLLSWIDGNDLSSVLLSLSPSEQYRLGQQAGSILKKIHTIPLEPADYPIKTKKEKKLRQLERYIQCTSRIAGDETVISYVRNNIDCIWKAKPTYLHGDFHPSNLILTADGSIGVIDFNRWKIGDPYEEFYKLESFGTEVGILYCKGQIDSYFDNAVPQNFWEALAVYSAHAALFSIVWAEPFGEKEIQDMRRRAEATIKNYENFSRLVPKWYEAAAL